MKPHTLLLALAGLSAFGCEVQSVSAQTHYYRFVKKYVDLDTLKPLAEAPAAGREVKREAWHAPMFGQHELASAEYKDSVFKLEKDRKTSVSDKSGKLIKTFADPDSSIPLDNVSGNTALFAVTGGVVRLVRLQNGGYAVRLYDEKGTEKNHWTVPHTRFKKEGNVVESIPYLYFFAHTLREVVFSSLHSSGPQETVVLNIGDGSMQRLEHGLAGILVTADGTLAGLAALDRDRKKLSVAIGKNKLAIGGEYFGDAVKMALSNHVLYVANYHNIATGSSLYAYDINTGKLLWKGDVKQLMVGHSEYYNTVYLTLYNDKLILEGNEAGGSYLQLFDTKTGKRLFEIMP